MPVVNVNRFQGEFRFLSNFWPVSVEYMGLTFPSVEHAYQAAKCVNVEDRILFTSGNPGAAKRLGRRIKVRSDWWKVKVPIMRELLFNKFSQEPLRSMLQKTKGMELVEGNDWGDKFWGVCNGVGQNWLGKLLMQVREKY